MSSWMEHLASRMSLPAEVLPGTARLTLTGSDQVRIENQKCLLSYAPDAVEVGCGKLRLRVRGSELRICGMDREELLITGNIMAVEVDGA